MDSFDATPVELQLCGAMLSDIGNEAGADEVLSALRTMGRLLGSTGQDYASLDEVSAEQLHQSGEGL